MGSREPIAKGYIELHGLSRKDAAKYGTSRRFWGALHYALGVPATVLASLAATLGGAEIVSVRAAAFLAGGAALFAALVTFLNPNAKWQEARRLELRNQAIAERASGALTTRVPDLNVKASELSAELASLKQERDALLTPAPALLG